MGFFNYTFQYIGHATYKTWADPERGHGVRTLYPGQLQVTIGFLRNTGTDPLEKQLDPFGVFVRRGLLFCVFVVFVWVFFILVFFFIVEAKISVYPFPISFLSSHLVLYLRL